MLLGSNFGMLGYLLLALVCPESRDEKLAIRIPVGYGEQHHAQTRVTSRSSSTIFS